MNDVGRLFDPTYLLVLNPEHQFKNNRFSYVKSSRASAVFSQLRLGINHPNFIQFKLGKRGGTEITAQDALPYTRNSPYVAVCLAAYMGARRIGLIGVDFTDNHFFANTGKHPLSKNFHQIDREYNNLFTTLQQKNIELINLSSTSLLKSLPSVDINSFCENFNSSSISDSHVIKKTEDYSRERRVTMKIAIEKRKPGIVGDFLDAFAEAARSSGHEVSRNPLRSNKQKDVVSVVWNGRSFHSSGPVIYCEHGWLPRWDYQLSLKGINASSHLAPFVWDGRAIGDKEKQALKNHLNNIRKGGPQKYDYMQTDVSAIQGIIKPFLLVPLQMERDTNIMHHVPLRYRRMQALIDDVSQSNPPIPIIFKQHPADVRNGNRQLHLRLKRKQDTIWSQNKGNIHQLLKSGMCKGIISLNSNVVHDGLVWGVASIVLGSNIWPETGVSPFYTELPKNWDNFLLSEDTAEKIACRDAYAYYLMKNQWSMNDIKNKHKVAGLLDKIAAEKNIMSNSRVLNMPARTKPVINVVARNRGWLFEDLKKHFLSAATPSVTIRVSEKAFPGADSWIYLRTSEAKFSPDLSRTVVQIHDMFNGEEYRPGGSRHCVDHCGAIVLTHPEQKKLLLNNGIYPENKRLLEKPVGASSYCRLRTQMSEPFTVAWIGRPTLYEKQEIKRVNWFVEAVRKITLPIRVVFVGEKLEKEFGIVKKAGIDSVYYTRSKYSVEHYPKIYRDFDCVVVTAANTSRQSSMFEALASGVPVIATPTAWADQYIENNKNGYLVNTVNEIVVAINQIYINKQSWFDRRVAIRNSVEECTLESWIRENIQLAMQLTGKGKQTPGEPANSRLIYNV